MYVYMCVCVHSIHVSMLFASHHAHMPKVHLHYIAIRCHFAELFAFPLFCLSLSARSNGSPTRLISYPSPLAFFFT